MIEDDRTDPKLSLLISALHSDQERYSSLFETIISINHSINQRLYLINQRIDSLNQRIDSFNQRLDSINQTIVSVNHSLSQQIDSLNQSTQALYHSHRGSLNLAMNSSCRIRLKLFGGVVDGCGNLIFVNGKYYVSTCLYVLYDEFKHTFSGNISILMNQRGNITIGREILIFNTSSIDLALIEAFPTSKQKKYAVKVSDQSSSIGDSLVGVSFRSKAISVLDCKIIEKLHDPREQSDYQFRTNCDGGPDSSGTGYLNDDGFLVAIHDASTTYDSDRHNLNQEYLPPNHPQFQRSLPIDEIIANAITNISAYSSNAQNTTYLNNSVSAITPFYRTIQHEININSPNPRAGAVSSKAIFDLVNNATSRTLRVKFGDTIILSSFN